MEYPELVRQVPKMDYYEILKMILDDPYCITSSFGDWELKEAIDVRIEELESI